MSAGTNVKLSFERLLPSTSYSAYASNYDGYDGFNFEDMALLSRAGIEHYGLQDTGYGSVLHGNGEATTLPNNTVTGYGVGILLSETRSETFTLKSGIFASAWDTSQPTGFTSYTAKGAKALVKFTLSQAATTINVANYGNDFKHIVMVKIVSLPGQGGSMGPGYNIAMDNLKVHWFGAIPGSDAMEHHAHVSHALLAAMGRHSAPGHSDFGQSGANGQHNTGYHGELASLASLTPHGGGLTAEFSLPQAEHFGT